MYKSEKVQTKNTFHVELLNDETGEELIISVFPPKMKTLVKFTRINSNDSDTLDDTINIISDILSKNKEKISISADTVSEIFDFDDVSRFIDDFFEWLDWHKKK